MTTQTTRRAKFPFWVSWNHRPRHGTFVADFPCWLTYSYIGYGRGSYAAYCASAMARDDDEARDIIFRAHRKRPPAIDFRFVDKKRADWSPFSRRFPRADWMVWPEAAKA